MLETISDTYDLEVIEPPIPKTIKFAEAPAAGRSILATSRSSKGAQAYREVGRQPGRAGRSVRAGKTKTAKASDRPCSRHRDDVRPRYGRLAVAARR